MLIMWAFITFNLVIINHGVNIVFTILQSLLAVKDIWIIIEWLVEEDDRKWFFDEGLEEWGYIFLRSNLSFPVILAMLNLCIIRWGYFRSLFFKY